MVRRLAGFLFCLTAVSNFHPLYAADLRPVAADHVIATAETPRRTVQLEQGSNFRDIGGYRAAGGKTVRWGRIYRSGATPLLTGADIARIKELGISQMIDLRSSEERALAPTRLEGVPYSAVGYSMSSLMAAHGNGRAPGIEGVYRAFPTLLAPQIRLVVRALADNHGPIVYNCSAGQDRTGFVTAVVLSALGVSRDDIEKDYLMSTALRRPQYEMPRIDVARYADNPVALMFARWQRPPHDKASPLYDKDGTFLRHALDEVEKRWGSMDNYLRQQVGVSQSELAIIRAQYLD